jgi:lysophospholipase L1-like esterase
VGNVGRPGHGTAQHAVQLEKLLPQHPEIDAVLLLAGINDMLFNLGWSLVPRDAPRPTLSPPEGHSAGDPFSVTPVRDTGGSWYQRLALTRALTRLAGRSSGSDPPIIDRSFGFVNEARRARQQAREYRDQLPDLAKPLAGYAAALREIAGINRARGVRLILLTQPVFWRPDLDGPDQARLWMGGAPFGIQGKDAVYYSVEALARGMQRYNAAMLRVCAELSIECIDLAGALPRDGSVFIDDAHFTEHGAQLVADQVAAHLRSTEPLRSFVSAGG